MIPVPVFGVAVYVLYALGWVALVVLVIWGTTLSLSPAARTAFAWTWQMGVLLTVLVLTSAFSTLLTLESWLRHRRMQQAEAALHITTTAPVRVAGVTLPIGTQLTTRQPGVLESFEVATFPSPTSIYGVRALTARRSIPYTLGDSLREPTDATVTLAADEMVDGWRCSSSGEVEFILSAGGAVSRLRKCTLAAGNQAGTLTLPAGATLLATEGTIWGDGTHETDRWTVMVEDSAAPIRLFGAELRPARVYLSERRAVVRLDEAALASEFRSGDIRYPKGTRVSSPPPPLRARYPGALMFSPGAGQVVTWPGHPDVTAGFTLVQSPEGRVHGVFPNADVGVLEFQRIEVVSP